MAERFYLEELVPYEKFSQHTKVKWEGVTKIPKEAKLIYCSKSGSKYWILGSTLYRKSTHWGCIGTCNWFIKNACKVSGKKYGPCKVASPTDKRGHILFYYSPIIGKCHLSAFKFIAPKAPPRYIKDDKGFLIINPDFKIYSKSYNFASN